MEPSRRTYQKLEQNLEEITKVYRGLLEIVRKEKEYLISANIEQLNESNHAKESFIARVKVLDQSRQRIARELAEQVGADTEQPRLLDIASRLDLQEGERLRQLHGALDLLIRRLVELNRENEIYAQSAINNLSGALGEVKETLQGKTTYEKRGRLKEGKDSSGHLVRKEI